MLPPLFAMTREAVLTQPPTVPPERRWHPLEAASAVEARPNLHILPDFFEAVGSARRAAGQGTVVVTGPGPPIRIPATGRSGSLIHSLQDPAYSRAPSRPASSMASRSRHAVTPEPHMHTTC